MRSLDSGTIKFFTCVRSSPRFLIRSDLKGFPKGADFMPSFRRKNPSHYPSCVRWAGTVFHVSSGRLATTCGSFLAISRHVDPRSTPLGRLPILLTFSRLGKLHAFPKFAPQFGMDRKLCSLSIWRQAVISAGLAPGLLYHRGCRTARRKQSTSRPQDAARASLRKSLARRRPNLKIADGKDFRESSVGIRDRLGRALLQLNATGLDRFTIAISGLVDHHVGRSIPAINRAAVRFANNSIACPGPKPISNTSSPGAILRISIAMRFMRSLLRAMNQPTIHPIGPRQTKLILQHGPLMSRFDISTERGSCHGELSSQLTHESHEVSFFLARQLEAPARG